MLSICLGAMVWEPHPILAEVGGFTLRWYSILFAAGFVINYFVLKHHFKQEGEPLSTLDRFLTYSVVGTILGARIGNCVFYDWDYFSDHLLEIILPFRFSPEFQFVGYRGLASHGALLGLLVAYALLARSTGRRIGWFLDHAAVVSGLCLACIRMGNFMNGEVVGTPTDWSWGVVFSNVDPIPRHPVQLYGFVTYLSFFFFMLWYRRRTLGKVKTGHLLGVFLVLLGLIRFGMEFIKRHYVIDPDSLLNMAQWLCIPMIIGGSILLILTRTTGRDLMEKNLEDPDLNASRVG